MAPRRKEVELSVERELGPADAASGVVRLTARFEVDASGKSPPLAELKAALAELGREMDGLVGPASRAAGGGRAERSLAELVETYRPRQRELIDLLREEGELSDSEHALLASRLPEGTAARAPAVAPPPAAAPPPLSPNPATPAPAERGLPAARPVPELLRTYQISTLRQAGAVRARRQISFAEYMALKRHFEATDAGASEAPSPPASGT